VNIRRDADADFYISTYFIDIVMQKREIHFELIDLI